MSVRETVIHVDMYFCFNVKGCREIVYRKCTCVFSKLPSKGKQDVTMFLENAVLFEILIILIVELKLRFLFVFCIISNLKTAIKYMEVLLNIGLVETSKFTFLTKLPTSSAKPFLFTNDFP